MSGIKNKSPKRIRLPKWLNKLFWDYDFDSLSWENDRDLIIRRILESGNWKSIQWLRKTAGDSAILSWIESHKGRGLDARKLRYWGVILNINKRKLNAWINFCKSSPWENRTKR